MTCSRITVIFLGLGLAGLTSAEATTTAGAERDSVLASSGAGVEADSDANGQDASILLRRKIQNSPAVQDKLPPLNRSQPDEPKILVDVCYTVFSVLEVDDAQQTMKMLMHVRLVWQDPSLRWNKSVYGEDAVELDASALWTPKIIIANSAETQNSICSDDSAVVTVGSEGEISMLLAINTQIICAMDLTSYPFDQQDCPVYFYSLSPQRITWTLSACNGDVKGSKFMEKLILSSDWEFLGSSDYLIAYENRTFPVVEVHVQRKSQFYIVCLVLPLALTSYINSLVFVLPRQSGERLSFLVTIFVSTSVFTGLFSDMVPRGTLGLTLPHIMELFIGVLSESMIILVATILISRRYHSEQEAAQVSNASPATQLQQIYVHAGSPALTSAVSTSARASVTLGHRNSVTPLSATGPDETENQKSTTSPFTKPCCRKLVMTSELINNICFAFSLILKTTLLCAIFWSTSGANNKN